MLSWGPGLLLCFLVVSVLQMVDLVAYTGSPRDELGHRLKGCQLRAGPEGHFPVAQCPPSGPGSSHLLCPFHSSCGSIHEGCMGCFQAPTSSSIFAKHLLKGPQAEQLFVFNSYRSSV